MKHQAIFFRSYLSQELYMKNSEIYATGTWGALAEFRRHTSINKIVTLPYVLVLHICWVLYTRRQNTESDFISNSDIAAISSSWWNVVWSCIFALCNYRCCDGMTGIYNSLIGHKWKWAPKVKLVSTVKWRNLFRMESWI